MFRATRGLSKHGWQDNPGKSSRGGKNAAWKPKIPEFQKLKWFPYNMEHPKRRPNNWHDLEFQRLGMVEWPKEVGFFNSGDNFEVTPEMMWRLFLENMDSDFWSSAHCERTVVHLMPWMESHPKETREKVQQIFQHYVRRYTADHVIYNVVMQASAFGKDLQRCVDLLAEMRRIGLQPNAQTFINMMLACTLCGRPSNEAEHYFKEAVRLGALVPVMRLDTEFKMWMDQIERMGSFSGTKGYLAHNKNEGAKARPVDMWALWGWDKSERKFATKRHLINCEVVRQVKNNALVGTVYSKHKRQPWAKYQGMLRYDFKGPMVPRQRQDAFLEAPPL